MPLSSTLTTQTAQESVVSATKNHAARALPPDEAAVNSDWNSSRAESESVDGAIITVPIPIMCSGANKEFSLALLELCTTYVAGAKALGPESIG